MRRVMKPVWLHNVVECMKSMEVVLDEKCSDLDYTAVKVGIGRGDDESGINGPIGEACMTINRHVMRLWFFSSSLNSFLKRACAAIQ